jgi:hypothetical protein
MTVGKVLILPDRNACLDVIDDLRTHSESFFSVCAVNNDEQGNITDLKVTDAVTNIDSVDLRIPQCFQRLFDTRAQEFRSCWMRGILEIVDALTAVVIADNSLENDSRASVSWDKGNFPRAHLRRNRDNIGINNHGVPLF